MAAACAVKRLMDRGELCGTVRYYGCPGEESGAGKGYMVRAGVFEDVDICLTWHPMDVNGVMSNTLANMRMTFAFHGISAHAAVNPHMGRSALDALELTNVGCNYLREHIIPEARLHYAVTNAGGTAPNVVQGFAEEIYCIRAPKQSQLEEIFNRVCNVARGAALMTDTKLDIRVVSAYANLMPNKTLQKLALDKLKQLCPPDYSSEELLGYRIFSMIPFYLVTVVYIIRYAYRVKADPTKSYMYGVDTTGVMSFDLSKAPKLEKKHILPGIVTTVSLAYMIYIAVQGKLTNPMASAIFMYMGLLVGITYRMSPNKICKEFMKGVKSMCGTAMMIGFAYVISLILTQGNVLDTIVHFLVAQLIQVPKLLQAPLMFFAHVVINFFVTSGSGQAATMGFVGALGVPFGKWFQYAIKLFALWCIIGSILLVIATVIGYA